MGIGGHILGEKKLRRLSRLSGLDLDRAYIRGHASEGRVIRDGGCVHYAIDPSTGEHERINQPMHWTSCPRAEEGAGEDAPNVGIPT